MIVFVLLVLIAAIFISITSLSEEGKLPYGYNKKDTWENKYKPHWLPFRTTVFSFTTDTFHGAQFTYLTAIQLLISVSLFDGWNILISFVVIKVLFSSVLQLTRWTLDR